MAKLLKNNIKISTITHQQMETVFQSVWKILIVFTVPHHYKFSDGTQKRGFLKYL